MLMLTRSTCGLRLRKNSASSFAKSSIHSAETLARSRVDGVLHGIGGQYFAVITDGEAGFEVAKEQNLRLSTP